MTQDYLRAASLLERISDPHATGWIANYDVHPVDVRDTTFDFRGQPIPARVYLPRGVGFAPGIVVVHGMHELGIDEPRLVNFARSLAASGFFVMTPLVPGIADYRVEAESADLIGTAAQSFAQQLSVPRVGVLAISFSGGLALLAASDPQYAPVNRLGSVRRRILRSRPCASLLRYGRFCASGGSGRTSLAPRVRAADRGL